MGEAIGEGSSTCWDQLAELSRDGWFIAEVAAFAGDGVIILAIHPIHGRLERQGRNAGEITLELVEAAHNRTAIRARDD